MCRSGCRTKDHKSWGECARASRLSVGYCGIGGGDATRQQRWDTDLALYRDARSQGIQPDSTNRPDVEKALKLSDMQGAAYGRDFNVATPMED